MSPISSLSRSASRVAIILAAVLVLARLLSAPTQARDNKPGDFDFFVLALSWSPTFCDGPDAEGETLQCASGRRFAFVVHGLWPQYARGWPEFCRTTENWVPEDVIDSMLGIMPSRRLIIHQWRKHGSCTGLALRDYFRGTKLLFEKIRIPARYLSPQAPIITTPQQLVSDFVKSNRGLSADMLSVQCGNARDRARLSELRICLDRRGNFMSCGANEQRQCQARTLVMPPVR